MKRCRKTWVEGALLVKPEERVEAKAQTADTAATVTKTEVKKHGCLAAPTPTNPSAVGLQNVAEAVARDAASTRKNVSSRVGTRQATLETHMARAKQDLTGDGVETVEGKKRVAS